MTGSRDGTDVVTLAEVQRLLTTTDFASIDELARRADPTRLTDAIDRARAGRPSVRPATASAASAPPDRCDRGDPADPTPLPRRRRATDR